MTNWAHFKNFCILWKPWFKFPKLRIVRTDDMVEFKNNSHTVALYKPEDNSINILFEHRKNKAVFIHECGHWVNLIIYAMLEIIWEFIWRGCSLRNIFLRKEKEKHND